MTPGAAPQLLLAVEHWDMLRAAAEAAYPNEFCALLIGIDDGEGLCRVTRIVPAANVHPQPQTHFELDPRVLVDVLRNLRKVGRAGQEGGERLLGHVHSHPDGPARPSAEDLAQAIEPGMFWVVMAVPRGGVEAIKAFRVVEENGTQVAFQPVRIGDGVPSGGAHWGREETP